MTRTYNRNHVYFLILYVTRNKGRLLLSSDLSGNADPYLPAHVGAVKSGPALFTYCTADDPDGRHSQMLTLVMWPEITVSPRRFSWAPTQKAPLLHLKTCHTNLFVELWKWTKTRGPYVRIPRLCPYPKRIDQPHTSINQLQQSIRERSILIVIFTAPKYRATHTNILPQTSLGTAPPSNLQLSE